MLNKIRKELKENVKRNQELKDAKGDQHTAIFFKTGPGQYAEHDRFMGLSVPVLRGIAKTYKTLSRDEIQLLLNSSYNEERFLALIILVEQYQKSDEINKKEIYGFYLNNTDRVNNWNLVDASAHLIVGAQLLNTSKSILQTLVKSADLWERRIAIVSTWYFIRHDQLEWTFKLAKQLLNDSHDLIHKATGWMLREAGKKDVSALTEFLEKYADKMPRTMLRYAIEKFSSKEREYFLQKRSR